MMVLRDELLLSLQNFLILLGLFKRLNVMSSIADLFNSYLSESEGVLEVAIVSVLEIEEDQKSLLEETLARRFNSKLKIIYSQDATLIGGMIIKAENWVIDYSIQSMLLNLSNSFKEVY